jgi:hypothetical protein
VGVPKGDDIENFKALQIGLLATSKDLLAKGSKEAPLQNYKRACPQPKMR